MIRDLTSDSFIYGVRLKHDPTYEYRYVGLTTRGNIRFLEHALEATTPSHGSYHLPKSRWMRKHFNHVEYDVLEYSSNLVILPLLERKWIHILDTRGHRLLNLTDGGEGTFGWSPSVEWRTHRSKLVSGRGNPMYGTVGELSPNFGRKKTVEERLHLSKIRTGEGNTFYGKRHKPETLELISKKKQGELNTSSKLRESDVRDIRKALSEGTTGRSLASKYGVSSETIYRIKRGETWSHVT